MKSIHLLILLIPLCAFAQPGHKTDLVPTAAHKALAVVSGQLRVQGLERSVDVLRDRWGVAHIYAQNQHDLFFAQGVVAAQDRLFQMELWKRAGQGRLAEILGSSELPRDVNAGLIPLVFEAVDNAIDTAIRFFDELKEARLRAKAS